MSDENLGNIYKLIHQIFERHGECPLTDAQLLERFAASRDAAAFELLVRRHSRTVLNACRRVLGEHDAEDVVQATFLALILKAGSIARRQSLAGWLRKVARRLALKAKAKAASQASREQQRAISEEVEDSTSACVWREVRSILDEEIERLPPKYRLPFVMCHLEGKTNAQAGLELGCPENTIASRLAWARQRLAKQLSRRDVILPAGAGAAIAWDEITAAASAPARLISNTVRAGLAYAAGGLRAGVVSAEAVALAEGVVHSMLMTKIGFAMGITLFVGMLAGGAGWMFSRKPASPPEIANFAEVAGSELSTARDKQSRKRIPPRAADKPLRVLLFTSAPTRDFQFIRAFLVREAEMKRVELSLYLQPGRGRVTSRKGVVEDVPPECYLQHFPTALKALNDKADASAQKDNLLSYDVIVACDPAWLQLPKASREHLEKWVMFHQGGLVAIAGPNFTRDMALAAPDGELKPVIDLYPIRIDAFNENFDNHDLLQPLRFFPAARESFFQRNERRFDGAATPARVARLLADLDSPIFKVRLQAQNELKKMAEMVQPFLRRALKDKLSLDARRRIETLLGEIEDLKFFKPGMLNFFKTKWSEFFEWPEFFEWSEFFFGRYRVDWQVTDDRPLRGFNNCYPDKGVKPGAVAIAAFPTGRCFLTATPYGSGKVVYLGSGETWRLRQYKEDFYERFWCNILRHASSTDIKESALLKPKEQRNGGASITP